MPLQLPPIEPSGYQQALELGQEPPRLSTETVRFWSDYNHLFYHPRSIVQLNEYELNSSLFPFERWDTGEELFANLDREHDLLDRDLRPLLEECDQLQGLQVLSGIDDAWGGFATKFLERVADDLGKGCRWVFGLQDGTRAVGRERKALRAGNVGRSLVGLNGVASMQVPLSSVPVGGQGYVDFDQGSRWHSSALQAVAFESLTLPTRLRRAEVGRETFDGMEATLDYEGHRQVAAAGLTVGDPADVAEAPQVTGQQDFRMANGQVNGVAGGSKDGDDGPLDIDFFPDLTASTTGRTVGRKPHTFSTIASLRGPWTTTNPDPTSRERPLTSGPRISTLQTSLLFPTLSSYPQIFRFSGRPEQLAVKASLSTSTTVADRIRGLGDVARRAVGVEERETLCDGLRGLAEEYEEGWSESEEGGEDE